MIARRARAVFVVALGLALAAPVAAQEAPPSPAPAAAPVGPPQPPAPETIPLFELAAQVEPARRFLDGVREAIAPDPAVVEIEQVILDKKRDFEQQLAEWAAQLTDDLTREQLDDVAARVRSADRLLEDWQKVLTARSQALESQRAEFDKTRELWKKTYEKARADSVPSELLEAIKLLRAEIKTVDKALAARFESVLKLQGIISEESSQLEVLANDIRRLRFEVRGRTFERNKPTLWDAFRALEAPSAIVEKVREGLERDYRNVRAFAQLQGRRHMVSHALVFVGILIVVARMRALITKRRRDGKTLGPSEAVFDHPISTALLLAVITAQWIYPYAPRAYLTWLGLLAVPSILILMPQVIAPQHRRVWFALAAFFVVDRLRSVVQPAELIQRSLFLLETAFAAGLVAWLIRGGSFADLVAPRWHRVWLATLQVAFAALVVATLANLFGYVSLADLLGNGVLRCAYSAVIVYAAVHVAQPLVAGLLRTPPTRAMRVLQQRRAQIERRAVQLIAWGAALWWVSVALDAFGAAEAVGGALTRAVQTPIGFGEAKFSIGDLLLFLGTIAAAWVLSRSIRLLLDEDVFPRTKLTRGVPHAISATVRYAILVAGFLLAAAAAGFEWNRITLLAGAFGVGIGFGLQNIINNFVSGLILLYERPIQVGDTVEVGSLVGEVKRIGIRSSSVRTWQGAEVIVPNGNLISEQVVNWTLSDRTRRIEIPVGVAYGSDPERVLELLEKVGATHPDVMAEPPPLALFQAFGESSLDFELRLWTSNFDRVARTRSEVAVAVHRALAEARIEIPFPQRDVRLIAGEKSGSD